ncbi:MAG: efflux RND transporter permease subunit [Pseudomonadales bacterium]|nr:efflux RND transporter permease subunit [Pseudomonadales bacterium]
MDALKKFYQNHVLANLTFGLVLALGVLAYMEIPRAKDPDINFNWISIITVLPGATSLEVEKRITDPIEDAISRTVKDLRFVSSTSRDDVSSILVRFNQLSKDEFRERITDLRREVQNIYNDQLPEEAIDPEIMEITTSSGYPAAMLALTAETKDDEFRLFTTRLKREMERLEGIDEVLSSGLEDPELHIAFDQKRLRGLGVNPVDLAATVGAYFRDVSIGDIETREGRWLVRLEGTGGTIDDLEAFPIVTAKGVVTLGSIADVYRAASEPSIMVSYEGDAAVLLVVNRQDGANVLALLDRLKEYIDDQNEILASRGYHLSLVDDQTVSTRDAINVMQRNAAIGLILVVVVVFVFLGGPIALLTGIGIPFTLAATFFILNAMGSSLNNNVLLGVVIALGMLVDDAVVVVETIYYKLERGAAAVVASIEALREVAAPVFTSVLTTVSVFFPLMLLPGILGEFLRVVPMVVCMALLISLLQAFWMLPAHVSALNLGHNRRQESRSQRWRRQLNRKLRHSYSLVLIKVMRNPWKSMVGVVAVAGVAVTLLATGFIKFNFFAADPFRMVYVNAEHPTNATLSESMESAKTLEKLALDALEPGELRSSVAYSGQMFTQTEPLFGDNLSQVFISLEPIRGKMRSTHEVIAAVEEAVGTRLGDAKVSVFMLEDGPPVGQPINVKVRGKSFEDIQLAIDELSLYLEQSPLFKNISTDFKTGSPEMVLSLNGDAIQRAGVHPEVVTSTLQSLVDGILIGQYQSQGEEVDIRLVARQSQEKSLDRLLNETLETPNGGSVALGTLLKVHYGKGYQNIRHYNFLRAITLSADIDDSQTDTVAANQLIADHWETIRHKHPKTNLDFSGILDDIEEGLQGIKSLFIIGIGLVYLILGTQFRSYLQPVLILVSVPLAFIGVVFGLVITGNPLSLATMYGIVALSGIAVNSAIVLISAANSRLASGMSPLHATIYAARRRVVPILITSTTTVAGLFSLAAGIGGKSLTWGPIATAIVSGLMFSTVLVLVVIPLIYYATVRKRGLAE